MTKMQLPANIWEDPVEPELYHRQCGLWCVSVAINALKVQHLRPNALHLLQ